MLVPLKWLRELVPNQLSAEEIARSLTMAGLEVEGIQERHPWREGVVVARVLAVAPHPLADRLKVATVEAGGEPLPVICGAANCRPGLVTALALPGAELSPGTAVGTIEIRGVKSRGMLCSPRELGLSEDHAGILELPAGFQPGAPLCDAAGLEPQVLAVGITPNRGDALSILGVARDLAAIHGLAVVPPRVAYPEEEPPVASEAAVAIEDPVACPRYVAVLVRGVTPASSPLWMADRLRACGVRPISNVVDVTNYVMLELGQPLHAFDYARLAGHRIVVRAAREGERFTTLDGKERTLAAGMTLICDAERPVGLAGVMGGLNSEIGDDTRDVLVESAHFDPASTRRTGKLLALMSEAAYRFERGVDPAGCLLAARRAAQLLNLLAGGRPARGAIDVHPAPWVAPRIPLSVAKVSRFLGLPLTWEEVTLPLRRLGVALSPQPDGDGFLAEPPAHRPDLERPVDLCEEVARLVGYHRFPAQSPVGRLTARPRAWRQQVREKSRDLLCALGLDEIVTYSFAHPRAVEQMGYAADDPRRRVVGLLNPLSEEQSVLRTSLVPALLETIRRNLDLRAVDLALFEVGKVFWARAGEKQPDEPSRLAGGFSGLGQPASWHAGEKPVAFATVRGAVEYLCQGLGLPAPELRPGAGSPYLDPDISARVLLAGRDLGEIGLLAGPAAKAFDLDRPVYLFDLDFDLLAELAPPARRFVPLPRFPEVSRDLALVVDRAIPAGEVLAAARELAQGPAAAWLREVSLFDLYVGKPLAKGEKSLGLRFRYRDEGRTLTEKEVLAGHEALVAALLARFGGRVRG